MYIYDLKSPKVSKFYFIRLTKLFSSQILLWLWSLFMLGACGSLCFGLCLLAGCSLFVVCTRLCAIMLFFQYMYIDWSLSLCWQTCLCIACWTSWLPKLLSFSNYEDQYENTNLMPWIYFNVQVHISQFLFFNIRWLPQFYGIKLLPCIPVWSYISESCTINYSFYIFLNKENSAAQVFNTQAFLKKRSRSTNQPPDPMVVYHPSSLTPCSCLAIPWYQGLPRPCECL